VLHGCTGLVLLLRNSSSELLLLWEFVKVIYNLHGNKYE
jgi:hypothetical protein